MNDHKAYAEPAHEEILEMGNAGDVDGLLKVLKYTQKRDKARYAISELQKIGNGKAIAPLMDYAVKGNHGLSAREDAIKVIGDIGKHDSIPWLTYILGKGGHVAGAAAGVLGKMKAAEAVPMITALALDEGEERS